MRFQSSLTLLGLTDDNPVLAMAIAGQADYLVTGDRRGLLFIKKIGNTRIVTARELLRILKKHK